MNKTIMKSATVKVIHSHNYNHFEASICLENEEGLNIGEINEARKDCNRLCDTAIRQYNEAKEVAERRINLKREKAKLIKEVALIKKNDKKEWTPEQKAKVKALEDHNWDILWDYDDYYEDFDF